jgi:hypothetical protein
MSKYNNEILDSIYERYTKFNSENTLSLGESKDEYVLMMKKGLRFISKKRIEANLQNLPKLRDRAFKNMLNQS